MQRSSAQRAQGAATIHIRLVLVQHLVEAIVVDTAMVTDSTAGIVHRTFTSIAPVQIDAGLRVGVAIVSPSCAFIDIRTNLSIPFVACVARTSIPTAVGDIGAGGVVATQSHPRQRTFIDISAVQAVTGKTGRTWTTSETRSWGSDICARDATEAWIAGATIDVCTDVAVSLETCLARAYNLAL